jgi:tetratricopeptide (TPR) repeat protein
MTQTNSTLTTPFSSRTRQTRSRPRSQAALAGLLVLLLAAPRAFAQQPDEAKSLVRQGNAKFEVGKYDEALKLYERAYNLRQEPKWLFNMAQAQRELKNYPEAIRLYELFLAKIPDHPDKAAVLKLVEELKVKQTQLTAEAKQRAEAAARQKAEELRRQEERERERQRQQLLLAQAQRAGQGDQLPSRPWYKRWYVWTIVGAVVAGAVVGGVLGTQNPNPAIPTTQHGNMAFFGAR